MMGEEEMKHSLYTVHSDALAASSSPMKLSFDGVGDGDSRCREKDLQGLPGTTTAVNAKEVVSTRKRGASAGSGVSEASSAKAPSPCRSKKTTLPPTAHGPQGSIKAHHHRRSPSLHTENVATNSEYSTSATCPARSLGQSASFSGGITSTQRPGGRDVQISPTLRGGTSKSARHGSGSGLMSSRRLIAQQGEAQRSNYTEVEEDATFCRDNNVQVFIRARPVNRAEIAQQRKFAKCIRQENAHSVSWLGQPETRFTFDHVAGEFVTQGELFRVAGLPMVDNCMAGYNSCMFAYGQTGSGKTHTMLGDIGDFENRGMTPRVFEYLFKKIRKEEEAQKQGKLKYKCRCSFLEIYNEQISDLLEPSSTNLQMREDVKKGVFVEGLLEVEVQNLQDVLDLLILGATNRKVAATNMNRESSRSHSVFTCVIESQWECDSMINFRFGRLNLVDLAGSERQKDTGGDEERLREAASINKSLSTLGLVIMVLVDIANGKQRHVPYRDSKLTFLLQDSLGGNSKTTIIANISPSSCASSETLSTLKFAQRAKFIQNNAVINEEASGDVKGMQEQIQQLKDELARIQRQSVSRMPSKGLSERKGGLSTDHENTGDAKDSFDPLSPTQGSFLQFGRAVPSPTVLNHKVKAMEALLVGVLRREKLLVKTSAADIEHLALLVKQREDETYFHKSTSSQSREQEIRSETCDAEESSSIPSELGLPLMPDQCNNLDHMTLSAENIHLQERLRRCQEYDALQERETMIQDISNLRKKLLDMLDRNISMDAAPAFSQQEALVAELAAERQVVEHLRNEVESFRTDLSECRMKLQTSLESNERIARELDALRLELESSKDECRKHKQDLTTLQLKKALEVNCLELKQAQHQHVVLELKAQLQESEEKAEQETIRRNQIELRLQETLQESTNLQTELQWTRDSLEGVEAVVETFQRSEPVLEIGDPEASYEAFMVGQLQADLIEMHARLEDERKHGRELEYLIKANNGNLQELAYEFTNNFPKHNLSMENPCNEKEKRNVKHQEAILQLQMELDSIESGASDAIKGHSWEDAPVAIDMELQLDVETWEGVLAGERQNLTDAEASSDRLRQKLEDLTKFKLNAEKALNFSDSLADLKGIGNDLKSSTLDDGKHFSNLQREWEGAALRMFDQLAACSPLPLMAATPELKELPSSPSLHLEKKNPLQQYVDRYNMTAFSLKERLHHAQMLATSAEKNLQDVSDLMFNSMGSWSDTCNALESVLQTYQNMKVTKKNLEACNTNLQEVGWKSAVASTLVWWMSETATFRNQASRVTWDGKEKQLGAENEVLKMQVQSSIDLLENILAELSTTEAQVQEVVDKMTGESMAKKQTVIAREQTLVAAVAEAEQRLIVAEAARLKLEEELKHLEAAHDLQHQIEMKEEEIAKLKEQAETEQADWVVEKSDLQVAFQESEDRCVEKNQTITNLEKMLENSENRTVAVQLEEWLGTSMTKSAVDNLTNTEKSQHLRTNTTEDACLEDNWNNVAKDFATSKIVVLQSRCEGYTSGKAKVKLARTQVLLTGSEGKVKLLSEMVAKIQKNRSEDHSDIGSVYEKLENLNLVAKGEQECGNILKAMIFSLDTENADLQHQLLQTEADSTALKSTLANLQRELDGSSHQRSEEVAALVSQLHVSDRHIFKLECQSVELRDAMQRQAVAFGALYEQLHKQESLQMLEEEKAELMACRKKAERYQAKSRQLELQVEALQQEIERMQPLRKEIVLIYEELQNSRSSTEMAAQETDRLRSLVEGMERSRGQLQEEIKRKQCAIEALEVHLLQSEQSKLQCQEELHLCEKMAEVSKTRAQEKQVEVEILGKSVEELENTVYAMESQAGLLKREGELERSVRENMERELQGLKQQNVNLRTALTKKNSINGDGVRRETNAERKLEQRKAEIQLSREKLEKYQMSSNENISFPQPTIIQKGKKKPKGSIGSPFRWFKMNHQVHSELDEERKSYERRIQELEDVLGNRQNEVTVLKEKLADAERVTRDVLRVLRGFKVDMANVATPVEKQQVEDAHIVKSGKRTLQKDEEIERIVTQLNDFIEERESWLEIISRKQAELTAIQADMEKLGEREKALVAENKKFKNENRMQIKKIGQLEQEMKTLCEQRTKHHVKIKDENNALRIQNNDLSAKLRRLEHVNTRVSGELAKYRTAQGRQPLLNIEEEQRLRTKLQEAQERSNQVVQKLACFSARVVKAAGMLDCNNNNTDSPSVALEALEQMKDRLESTQLELDNFKLKTRIAGERQRLSEMRTGLSPMRGINAQSVTPR